MNPIDRRSPIPLYYQLAQALRQKILAGEFAAGGQLPSERDLMHTYQLSRNTVRQAIDLLVEDGLVYHDHGRGNFISGAGLKIRYKIDTVTEHAEFIRQGGRQPDVRPIEAAQIQPPQSIRAALQLDAGEKAVRFTKLFLADGKPAILSYDYVPCRYLDETYDPAGSGEAFFDFLERITGRRVEFVLSDVIPAVASQEVAHYLALPKGSPVVLLEELFLDPGQSTPLAFAYNYYHHDIQFRILRRRS